MRRAGNVTLFMARIYKARRTRVDKVRAASHEGRGETGNKKEEGKDEEKCWIRKKVGKGEVW